MFVGAAAQPPPCEAGKGPGENYLLCESCGVGQYAVAGGYCQGCPPGVELMAFFGPGNFCQTKHVSLPQLQVRLPLNAAVHVTSVLLLITL